MSTGPVNGAPLLLVDCGCLNLVKGTVTPDLGSSYAVESYAVESYAVLEQLQLRRGRSPARSCGTGSRSSTPTAAGWTWTPGSPTWPR